MSAFAESDIEAAALEWLQAVGYAYVPGPEIAPGEPTAERATYRDVILTGRLRAALAKLNPALPRESLDDAVRQLTRAESPNLVVNNHRLHRLLVDGVPVSFQQDGRTVYVNARVLDFDQPRANDWLAVNQFSIQKQGSLPNADRPLEETRRPDVLLFVNGLPLAVIELKNAADEKATVETAYTQLQTYKQEIPDLFIPNAVLVASDGTDARLGSLTASWDWFKRWRSVDGETLEEGRAQLEVLIRGALAPERLLDLLRYFTVFEDDGRAIRKKLAGYHQYFAVNKAVAETVRATGERGNKRVGVVWHTQGSGKSLSMLFYAGKVIQQPAMANPTLVVLTDRNDLDDQLFDTFALGYELLHQAPQQAESRTDLRERLRVASGGVVFTTIQKFLPEMVEGKPQGSAPLLSERRNIVFIVDEAHRTQYGFEARYVEREDGLHQVYGLAKYLRDALPNAAFIGFTGTPVSAADRNTRNVFGDYIDVYDIQRAVEDQATVPIYYDARHAKLKLSEAMLPRIDPDFEEVTEGEEVTQKERLKSKWAQMAAIVGADDRVALIAQDIVAHFEARDAALPGKGMIVCMTREICVKMYDALIKLRPEWVHPDDDKGLLKVVMSGSASDPPAWQVHIRSKQRSKEMANRFRDSETGFKLVIVRDMWLTGFDAPSLHTMYVDKPMQGLSLMQAIARVNRVYPGKDGGLVVAYLPLQMQLQEALKDFTEGDRELTGKHQDLAADLTLEKYEVVKAMFHGFDYQPFFSGSPASRLTLLANAIDHILKGREAGRDRYIDAVTALSRAFALANPHEKVLPIRDEVAFFQIVKAPLVKDIAVGPTRTGKTPQSLDRAVAQIVANAVAPEGVVDLFAIVGLPQPDISILSDAFLLEVAALPQRDLVVELLRRLIEDEIRANRRTNLIQSRSFAGMLLNTMERYNQQQIAATEIIRELVKLAQEMRAARDRGSDLGLTEEELAFYDALETNDSAVKILGDEVLKKIAQELVQKMRATISIDWEFRESARARMRVEVKKILRRHGYPPDKRPQATETVLEQAKLLSREWATW
ncbi:MAG TPA: type I restriction endonuclease subunit R [Anaerolineae bacterium]|nr:type I restriction endonuclease subunit R [Anaerolineae bacterium]HQH39123.1 type I restriction endonuclease subunit R [Anaerolineae bacterium]